MAKKKVEETAAEEAAAPVEETPEVEVEVVVPVVGKHVYINLSGGHDSYSLVEAPEAFSGAGDGRSWVYNRRFLYAGQNVEHVDEDVATGIWRYRQM